MFGAYIGMCYEKVLPLVVGYEHCYKEEGGLLRRIKIAPRRYVKIYVKPDTPVYMGLYYETGRPINRHVVIQQIEFDKKNVFDMVTCLKTYEINDEPLAVPLMRNRKDMIFCSVYFYDKKFVIDQYDYDVNWRCVSYSEKYSRKKSDGAHR